MARFPAHSHLPHPGSSRAQWTPRCGAWVAQVTVLFPLLPNSCARLPRSLLHSAWKRGKSLPGRMGTGRIETAPTRIWHSPLGVVICTGTVGYLFVSLCTHNTHHWTHGHCGWARVTMLPVSSRALVLTPSIFTRIIGGAVSVCAQQVTKLAIQFTPELGDAELIRARLLGHPSLQLRYLLYQSEVLLVLLFQCLLLECLLLMLAMDKLSHQSLCTLDSTAPKATELPAFSTVCGKLWGVGLSVQRLTPRGRFYSANTTLLGNTINIMKSRSFGLVLLLSFCSVFVSLFSPAVCQGAPFVASTAGWHSPLITSTWSHPCRGAQPVYSQQREPMSIPHSGIPGGLHRGLVIGGGGTCHDVGSRCWEYTGWAPVYSQHKYYNIFYPQRLL
ncbi:uncharacterized protein LOC118393539 isoform X1 [Oncorhynchus keta]|uniref:uncharacterized protein LOC118393539 isoform X1 n=1 Tax=Oncorhynchus keta TaxID=8018 RepID=UPI00227A1395|nr:uncharacterized protein LOC118393539 isoform X1 [Oncorhynchus keta]